MSGSIGNQAPSRKEPYEPEMRFLKEKGFPQRHAAC
jgi:hypothetical protein